VDCQVTGWGAWSSCSVTCGTGEQERLRSVVRHPSNGGKECPPLKETHTCATYPCPIDCVLSDWSDWTACSAACGEGSHTRTRRILTAASVDPPGATCGPLTEEVKCFSPRGACKQDCEMSEWSSWSSCSQSCGIGGKRLSTRRILKAGGLGGGKSCAGELLVREEPCNEDLPCVSNCEIGEWTEWTGCSVSCSERRTRIEERKLENEASSLLRGFQKENEEEEGQGDSQDETKIKKRKEKEQQRQLEFDLLLKQLSGGGKRMRTRAILKPSKNGGKACPPTEEIDETCNEDIPCPIDCSYAPWSEWSACSVSCGVGKRTRKREITREARFGGKPCNDLDDTIDCMADVLCVDDCEVSEWGEWTACSVTCGGGVRKRRRQVEKPPSNGGRPCPPLDEYDACGTTSCHGTDCEVSEWSAWSACTKACGGGVHVRTRHILVEKRGHGKDCPSLLMDREGCNLFRCPGAVCEDNPDVPTMTGGVDCRVLYAMGCDRSLKDLAADNDRDFPSHIPPETRVKDACPLTCGTCMECAPGCELRDLGNRHCDEACNNPQCQMDLGDCGGDCELPSLSYLSEEKAIVVEPPASSLTKGQSAILTCKDQGSRFQGLSALRQIGVVCRDRDGMQLIPEGMVFPSSSGGKRDGGRGKSIRSRGEQSTMMIDKAALQSIPPCVPDHCPWIYIEGFTSSSEEEGDGEKTKKKSGGGGEEERMKGKMKKKDKSKEVHVESINGFYYRGDAYRGYPRYVQDKFAGTKFFLWMHANAQLQSSSRAGGGEENLFVWRITQMDPLEGGGHNQEKNKGEKKTALSAVGMGKTCHTPQLGSDGSFECIDTWISGTGGGEEEEEGRYGAMQQQDNSVMALSERKSFSRDQISIRCLSSEEEKEDFEESLKSLASLSPSSFSNEENASSSSSSSPPPSGPPVTVVAGTPMICEDQPEVERVSQKTCKELKKLLKCDFVLEDAGVDELPDFLPSDATLALACPETCGLCKECSPRCPLWFLGNRHCDPACNNEACEYDRGDCDNEEEEEEEEDMRGGEITERDEEEADEEGHFLIGSGIGGRGRERESEDSRESTDGKQKKKPTSSSSQNNKARGDKKNNSLQKESSVVEGQREEAGDATACEDDPAVREMGFTCKLLLSVAEDGKGGCEAKLTDLDPNKELPPGIPRITRVKDACPKTCKACNDPDRLKRPEGRGIGDKGRSSSSSLSSSSSDPSTACEDDPAVKEMGYTCKLLVRAAEDHEGCNTRLLDLKPDQTLPPGIPKETRVKDACPNTCKACNDPDRLVRPTDPTTACDDHVDLVEKIGRGYTCQFLLSIAGSERLGGCEARLADLQRKRRSEGQEDEKGTNPLPDGIPPTSRVKDTCPQTCAACNDPSLLIPALSKEEKKKDLPCLGDCCDVPMLEQETGYTCKQIMEFVGGDCSVYLKDLSSSPLPPQVPPSTTLEDACPFTCGACAAQECVDNPLVESLGYTCKMILDASEGRGGCEATLQSLTPNPLPKDIPPYTRVKDACMKSCDACPTLRDTDPEDECHDDIRLPQLGFSCDILLAYATRGCSTPLYELFPPGTTLFDRSTLTPPPSPTTTTHSHVSGAPSASSEILPVASLQPSSGVVSPAAAAGGGGLPLDPNEPLSTYCRLSCNQCTQKKKRRSGGLSSHSRGGSHPHSHASSPSSSGCRNNPLVEAHGFSCSLLVKASSLGCNARLQDLSDSPLPPGIPPQTRVRDACLLECGGCIEIPTCYDGFQNGDEEGIDCGGSCRPCHACSPTLFKQLGEAYEIIGGKGIQHGAIRELRCAKSKGYEKVGGGKEPETLVCQDGLFPKPTLKCDVKKVEVQYASMIIEHAGDIGPESVSALYFSLLHALHLRNSHELRLLAIGTERRAQPIGGGTGGAGEEGEGECKDDPRVEQMGYSCSLLSSFCDAELHVLAQSQGKTLPAWLPKGAKVKDACGATCGVCDNRRLRRLSSSSSLLSSSSSLLSSSPRHLAASSSIPAASSLSPSSSSVFPSSSLQSLAARPLVIDYAVLWMNPNLPFSSVFTDETPSFFLNTLYKQFLDRGDVVINPIDGTLQQAALALKKRPFLVSFDSPRSLRLPLTIWSHGFGAFSPPEVARQLFSLSGVPLPTTQPLDLPSSLLRLIEGYHRHEEEEERYSHADGSSRLPLHPSHGDRGDLEDSTGRNGHPQGGGYTPEVDGPHASVRYSLASEKKTLIPLTPGMEKWIGVCSEENFFSQTHSPYDYKRQASPPTSQSCCSMHAELQALLEGRCGQLLYNQKLSEETVRIFCERSIEDEDGEERRCYASFRLLLDRYRNHHGPSCDLRPYAETVVETWCSRDLSSAFSASPLEENEREGPLSATGLGGGGEESTQGKRGFYDEGGMKRRGDDKILTANRGGNSGGGAEEVEEERKMKKIDQRTSAISSSLSGGDTNLPYCFAEIEKTLQQLESHILATRTSEELDGLCAPESCFRKNVRYLDAITQLQTAWRLMFLSPASSSSSSPAARAVQEKRKEMKGDARRRGRDAVAEEKEEREREEEEAREGEEQDQLFDGTEYQKRRLQRPLTKSDRREKGREDTEDEREQGEERDREEEEEERKMKKTGDEEEEGDMNEEERQEEKEEREEEEDEDDQNKRGEDSDTDETPAINTPEVKNKTSDSMDSLSTSSSSPSSMTARLLRSTPVDLSSSSSYPRRLSGGSSGVSLLKPEKEDEVLREEEEPKKRRHLFFSSSSSNDEILTQLGMQTYRVEEVKKGLKRRLQQTVTNIADILGIPVDPLSQSPSFFSTSPSSSFSSPSSSFSEEDYLNARRLLEEEEEDRSLLLSQATGTSSKPSSLFPHRHYSSSSAFFPSSSSPSSLFSSSIFSSPSPPRRRLKGFSGGKKIAVGHFDGPIGETLEEMINLICTKVDEDYCQQTLVLLAEDSPIKNPTLVVQPCSSRCFVPITGMLGGLLETYGERYKDPFHETLGKIMRAYGRFYCTQNDKGQVCGDVLFNRLKSIDVDVYTPQGIDFNLTQCKCPQSFVQDGQCDRTCFTEECGWDGQDCLVRRMFPEVYEALISMVDTSCLLYNEDFNCSSKCKKQYEHLLSAHENSCCLSAGLDVLSSILSVEMKHPLIDKKDKIWRPSRSIAYLEQMCGMSFDRTCSLGRPRQLIVLRTSILQQEEPQQDDQRGRRTGEGLQTDEEEERRKRRKGEVDEDRDGEGGMLKVQALLKDEEKMKEIHGIIQKSIAQRLRLVDRDITRINTRLAPFNGLEIETFIDSGIYADRSLLLLKNQENLRQLDETILRRLRAVDLGAYQKRGRQEKEEEEDERQHYHIPPMIGGVHTSHLISTRSAMTPAVSKSIAPPLPFSGSLGMDEIPLDLPKEACSVSDLHRLLHPSYSLLLGSSSSSGFPSLPSSSIVPAGSRPGVSSSYRNLLEKKNAQDGSKKQETDNYLGTANARRRRRLLQKEEDGEGGKREEEEEGDEAGDKRDNDGEKNPKKKGGRTSSLFFHPLSLIRRLFSPSSSSSHSSSLVHRRLQQVVSSPWSSPSSLKARGIAGTATGAGSVIGGSGAGGRAWYKHGEGEAVRCSSSSSYSRISGPEIDQVICDNGSWVFKNLLLCKRDCGDPSLLFGDNEDEEEEQRGPYQQGEDRSSPDHNERGEEEEDNRLLSLYSVGEASPAIDFKDPAPSLRISQDEDGNITEKGRLLSSKTHERRDDLFSKSARREGGSMSSLSLYKSPNQQAPPLSSSPGDNYPRRNPKGYRIEGQGTPRQSRYRHGSEVEVSCTEGYSPPSGLFSSSSVQGIDLYHGPYDPREGRGGVNVSPTILKCQDGVWRGRSLICYPLCEEFPYSRSQEYLVQGEGNRHGDQRNIACHRGFYPQHRSYISTCLYGKWVSPNAFECTRATPPDMKEGATGFQKILLQMFSSEGVFGLVIFTVLVTLAGLTVFIAWRVYYRRKAKENFVSREETVQALKMSSVPIVPSSSCAAGGTLAMMTMFTATASEGRRDPPARQQSTSHEHQGRTLEGDRNPNPFTKETGRGGGGGRGQGSKETKEDEEDVMTRQSQETNGGFPSLRPEMTGAGGALGRHMYSRGSGQGQPPLPISSSAFSSAPGCPPSSSSLSQNSHLLPFYHASSSTTSPMTTTTTTMDGQHHHSSHEHNARTTLLRPTASSSSSSSLLDQHRPSQAQLSSSRYLVPNYRSSRQNLQAQSTHPSSSTASYNRQPPPIPPVLPSSSSEESSHLAQSAAGQAVGYSSSSSLLEGGGGGGGGGGGLSSAPVSASYGIMSTVTGSSSGSLVNNGSLVYINPNEISQGHPLIQLGRESEGNPRGREGNEEEEDEEDFLPRSRTFNGNPTVGYHPRNEEEEQEEEEEPHHALYQGGGVRRGTFLSRGEEFQEESSASYLIPPSSQHQQSMTSTTVSTSTGGGGGGGNSLGAPSRERGEGGMNIEEGHASLLYTSSISGCDSHHLPYSLPSALHSDRRGSGNSHRDENPMINVGRNQSTSVEGNLSSQAREGGGGGAGGIAGGREREE
ncbi:thrombospondin type 1 domain-containing, partial [Cystoisospora suis]